MLSEISDECLTDAHCNAAVNNRYIRLHDLIFRDLFIDFSGQLVILVNTAKNTLTRHYYCTKKPVRKLLSTYKKINYLIYRIV